MLPVDIVTRDTTFHKNYDPHHKQVVNPPGASQAALRGASDPRLMTRLNCRSFNLFLKSKEILASLKDMGGAPLSK